MCGKSERRKEVASERGCVGGEMKFGFGFGVGIGLEVGVGAGAGVGVAVC